MALLLVNVNSVPLSQSLIDEKSIIRDFQTFAKISGIASAVFGLFAGVFLASNGLLLTAVFMIMGGAVGAVVSYDGYTIAESAYSQIDTLASSLAIESVLSALSGPSSEPDSSANQVRLESRIAKRYFDRTVLLGRHASSCGLDQLIIKYHWRVLKMATPQ